jgi:hypothetical protein
VVYGARANKMCARKNKRITDKAIIPRDLLNVNIIRLTDSRENELLKFNSSYQKKISAVCTHVEGNT